MVDVQITANQNPFHKGAPPSLSSDPADPPDS